MDQPTRVVTHEPQPGTLAGDKRLPTGEAETTAKTVTGGSLAEAIGGIAVVGLAIVGLAGVAPGHLLPIAVIVVGAALLLQGGAIVTEYCNLFATLGEGTPNRVELGGEISVEILAGDRRLPCPRRLHHFLYASFGLGNQQTERHQSF